MCIRDRVKTYIEGLKALGNVTVRVITVSYTHLDVYKRQVGRDSLQHELANVGELPLIALQRHIAQPQSNERKKHDCHEQRT